MPLSYAVPFGANAWAMARELNRTATQVKRLYLPKVLPSGVDGATNNIQYLPFDGSLVDYGYASPSQGNRDFTGFTLAYTKDSRRGQALRGYALVKKEYDPAVALYDSFTVSFFFKIDEWVSDATLFRLYDSANSATRNYTLSLVDTGSDYRPRLSINGSTIQTSNAVETGKWYHLAVVDTGDGATSTVTFYLNGAVAGATAYSRPLGALQTYDRQGMGSGTSRLSLDEFSYWDAALTLADVGVLYRIDNKNMNGRDLGYASYTRSMSCRITHIFGGGQRSSIEKMNLGREMTKNDRLMIVEKGTLDLAVTDTIVVTSDASPVDDGDGTDISYEITSIQDAGGVEQHLQVFLKAIE